MWWISEITNAAGRLPREAAPNLAVYQKPAEAPSGVGGSNFQDRGDGPVRPKKTASTHLHRKAFRGPGEPRIDEMATPR
jgi:hypothetical protein